MTGDFHMLSIDEAGAWSAWRRGGGEPMSIKLDEQPGEQEAAARIAEALHAADYRGRGLLLAIPSSWCLCAGISTLTLPRRKMRYQTMAYRLEEKLPIAAEEVACDFIESSEAALGIAVELDRIRPWVEALEQAGVTVQTIAPRALLATQGLGLDSPLPAGVGVIQEVAASDQDPTLPAATRIYLWLHGSGLVDAVTMDDAPVAWRSFPIEDVSLQLRQQAIGSPGPVRLIAIGPAGLVSDLRQRLSPWSAEDVLEEMDASFDAASARAAEEIIAGQLEPWCDLRRGTLAASDPLRLVHRPLIAALSAAAVLLASLCGSMLWRAAHYDRLADEMVQRQRTVFHEALPGQAVPEAVYGRMLSEEQRLRGVAGGSAGIGHDRSALAILHDLLARLPAEVRLRILEIRIDKDRVYIEGQARSHGDADLIAAALRRNQHFDIEPPRTEQLTGRDVAFTLTGTLIAAAPPAGASAVSGGSGVSGGAR